MHCVFFFMIDILRSKVKYSSSLTTFIHELINVLFLVVSNIVNQAPSHLSSPCGDSPRVVEVVEMSTHRRGGSRSSW